jgi:two-component system response regulator LytT
MHLVIIEDERVVAEDLAATLTQLIKEPVHITQLRSVKESVAYLRNKPPVDLIFSDIQLGDGLSFEIFVATDAQAPVIFCTAYDEYALDAFKANGIDYILKPFTTQTLEQALQRYSKLKMAFVPDYRALLQALATGGQRATSVLVHHRDKIIPVNVEDVALFYLEKEVVHLLAFSGKTYLINKNLDELEQLMGNTFFRANRQILVGRKAIVDVSNSFSRKLSLNLNVPFREGATVSKEKAPVFLEWLSKA